jgi:hypothetical protein
MSTVACAEQASESATVLYDDRVVAVAQTLSAPNDLWVTPEDLTRINGFEIKPQGVCLDELCIPLRQNEDSDLFVTRRGQEWFNVTELASKLEQAFVVDQERRIWMLRRTSRRAHRVSGVGHGAGLRTRGPRGQRRAALGFPGQEGLDRHLGIQVRMPIRSARLAEPSRRVGR